MRSTRTRPRNHSEARNAAVARTFTGYTAGNANDVRPCEVKSLGYFRTLRGFKAVANLYGRTCDGVGGTEAEAIERAKAVCEELQARKVTV